MTRQGKTAARHALVQPGQHLHCRSVVNLDFDGIAGIDAQVLRIVPG